MVHKDYKTSGNGDSPNSLALVSQGKGKTAGSVVVIDSNVEGTMPEKVSFRSEGKRVKYQ